MNTYREALSNNVIWIQASGHDCRDAGGCWCGLGVPLARLPSATRPFALPATTEESVVGLQVFRAVQPLARQLQAVTQLLAWRAWSEHRHASSPTISGKNVLGAI
jgi:hypothetical protein